MVLKARKKWHLMHIRISVYCVVSCETHMRYNLVNYFRHVIQTFYAERQRALFSLGKYFAIVLYITFNRDRWCNIRHAIDNLLSLTVLVTSTCNKQWQVHLQL